MYFEGVILPFSYNNEAERIKVKELELSLQMGIEERRDYEPLDLAVDIFVTTGGENPIMTRADYAHVSHITPKIVEEHYQGAIYMRKFLEYIGTSKDNYGLIKDSKCWSLFFEMGKTLNKRFGNDISSQVKKNETMESYFGLILYQLHVGSAGSNAREVIRNYGRNIVSGSDNSDFNDDVSDVVDDLSDVLQEKGVNNYSELTKTLTDNDDLVQNFGDKYYRHIRSALNGKNVEEFMKSIKKEVHFVNTLNEHSGLIGNVRYDELSNEQLKQLQSYMRDLKIMSEELFDKYGNEIK